MSRYWSVFVLSCAVSFASAQTPTQSLDAPTRESSAVQLLSRTLDQFGGSSVWQGVHGVEVQGAVTYTVTKDSKPKTITHPINWTDDWSNGHHRYIRTNTTDTGQRSHRSNGETTFTSVFQGRTVEVSQEDPGNILLTHCPGVVLYRILKDSTYGVRITPNSDAATGILPNSVAATVRVLVTKADHTVKQEWMISTTTGQVRSVRFTVPNVGQPGRDIWEKVTYETFASVGRYVYPASLTVLRPNQRSLALAFTSLAIDPAVKDTDFIAGDTQ